eukprot:6384539-Prymnesium_polylepis.1
MRPTGSARFLEQRGARRRRRRGLVEGCGRGSKDNDKVKESALDKALPPAQRLAAGGRLAAGDAAFEAKDLGANCERGRLDGRCRLCGRAAA